MVAVALVEAYHNIKRGSIGSTGCQITVIQVSINLPRGTSHLTHAAFEKVASEIGFRKYQYIRPGCERVKLSKDVIQVRQVSVIVGFSGTELRDEDVE